jgi:LPXTG-motif cell wall-anchored protein
MKRFGVALVAAVVLGLFVAAPALAGVSPTPSPTGSCYPPSSCPTAGHSGRTITGSNWCPGSEVQIFVDGDLVGTAHVASDGTFTFTLPNSVGPGTHHIEVVGLAPDCRTTVTRGFTIVLGGGGGTAFTGANISMGLLILGALLIVGAGALVAGRRRRITVK